MNSKQINRIEKLFDLSLPDQYRSILMGYPTILRCLLSHERELWAHMIYHDLRTITDINQQVRLRNPTWSNRYFIIGGDIGGNFYCIDVKAKTKNTKVYLWFHDDGDTYSLVSRSMDLFINHVFSIHAKYALDEISANQ